MMIDKEELKAALLALEANEVSRSETAYWEYLSDSVHDAGEATDADERSQQFESAEIAQSFESSIHLYSDAIEKIRQIDFGPKHCVEEGAAVCVNGRWLVVAVSTERFNVGKSRFMGISTSAPLYKWIEGKMAGEWVSFRGKELRIEGVA